MRNLLSRVAAVAIPQLVLTAVASAQPALTIRPLSEKKVDTLPAGTLFWRIENLPPLPAQASVGPFSIAVEAAGKAWSFTLGPAGGSTSGASLIGEVGPIPRVDAATYLLRINDASGPPGSVTPIHSHPGSEAFYVLNGEQSIRGTHGTMRVKAGGAEPGHGADMAMQVSSTGQADLHALVMFVVDADKPFSSPATLPSLEAPGPDPGNCGVPREFWNAGLRQPP
jgi:hypothetical protein